MQRLARKTLQLTHEHPNVCEALLYSRMRMDAQIRGRWDDDLLLEKREQEEVKDIWERGDDEGHGDCFF